MSISFPFVKKTRIGHRDTKNLKLLGSKLLFSIEFGNLAKAGIFPWDQSNLPQRHLEEENPCTIFTTQELNVSDDNENYHNCYYWSDSNPRIFSASAYLDTILTRLYQASHAIGIFTN